MKKITAGVVATGLALLWFFSVLPADAQVGGSSRDRSPRPIGPTAPGMRGTQEQQQEERSTQRHVWLQGDERQQEQLSGCFQLSATLAQHSRDIRKMLVASEVNWKNVAVQYADLKREIRLLTDKHEKFSLELNNGQRSWWQSQLQGIMTIQLQLHDRIEAIGRDLDGGNPESVPMVKAFTDLEGQFRRWSQLYGQIGADMNMPDLEQLSVPGRIRGLPGAQNPGR